MVVSWISLQEPLLAFILMMICVSFSGDYPQSSSLQSDAKRVPCDYVHPQIPLAPRHIQHSLRSWYVHSLFLTSALVFYSSAQGITRTPVIVAATIERWVVQQSSEWNHKELKIFLLMYRAYISPIDLLHIVISCFHWSLNPSSSTSLPHPRQSDNINSVCATIRVWTYLLFKYWLEHFFSFDFIPNPRLGTILNLSGVRVILNCACFLFDQNVALFFLLIMHLGVFHVPQPLWLSLRLRMLLRLENWSDDMIRGAMLAKMAYAVLILSLLWPLRLEAPYTALGMLFCGTWKFRSFRFNPY